MCENNIEENLVTEEMCALSTNYLRGAQSRLLEIVGCCCCMLYVSAVVGIGNRPIPCSTSPLVETHRRCRCRYLLLTAIVCTC
jgi:hypothetical protein